MRTSLVALKFALAIALVMLSGCASMRPNADEWTDKERLAFGLSIAAHTLDAGTTIAADWDRCGEMNPILGSEPSDASIVAFKFAVLGFGYWLHNSPKIDDVAATRYSFASAVIIGAIGVRNSQQDCF